MKDLQDVSKKRAKNLENGKKGRNFTLDPYIFRRKNARGVGPAQRYELPPVPPTPFSENNGNFVIFFKEIKNIYGKKFGNMRKGLYLYVGPLYSFLKNGKGDWSSPKIRIFFAKTNPPRAFRREEL